jgi:hypothetical protein
LRRLPVDQIEVLAVVLQMAANAVFAVWVFHPQSRMVTAIRREALRYLLVTIEALECWRACAKLVAACALRCAAE